MKILIATGIYPPDIGGPATYSKIVTEELMRRGHCVTVITYGTTKNLEYVRIVSRRLPKGIRHLAYFCAVMLHGLRADVIFAQDPVSVGFPVCLAAMILRKKFVVKIVGDYAWEQGVQRFGVSDSVDEFLASRYGFFVERLRNIERFVARRALAIIVPSEYLKRVVKRWGIQPNRIMTIANSVVTPTLVSREEARKKLGLGGTVLLSAGRLVPWKGFTMLISLMPELSKHGQVTLVIVGEGPDRAALEALRQRLKLTRSVQMPGAVSKEVLETYMAATDVFLLNTGYEGFSHQLLEVMLAGLPVITTHKGGNAEIIRDGENALVAGYNNASEWQAAIGRLVGDKKLCASIGAAGKKFHDTYTVDAMMQKLTACLSSL